MRPHTGHWIVAVMAAFVLIMAHFMVRAYHNQESLVAEDYYARELRYQEQIDKLGHAAALGEQVRTTVMPGRLRLEFPGSLSGEVITGELFLMRPNDPRADRRIPLHVDPQGSFTMDTGDMAKGAYTMHLEWQAGGVAYLTEDRIHLD